MASEKLRILFTVLMLMNAVESVPVYDVIPQRKPPKPLIFFDQRSAMKSEDEEKYEENMKNQLVEEKEIDLLLHLLQPSSHYYNIKY